MGHPGRARWRFFFRLACPVASPPHLDGVESPTAVADEAGPGGACDQDFEAASLDAESGSLRRGEQGAAEGAADGLAGGDRFLVSVVGRG